MLSRFGPQHPVLPEPIHFDLVTEDEKIVDAIPSISYVHRGLERLIEKRDFIDFVHVADRICGLCSFMHSLGYCQAVEEIMGIEVPERALYLRTIWAELSRIHSHIFWLGVAADAFGFESLFMQILAAERRWCSTYLKRPRAPGSSWACARWAG